MKSSFLTSVLLLLSTFLFPIYSETKSDSSAGAGQLSDIYYPTIFSYKAWSPIQINANGVTLETDSGSLKHDIAISLTHLPRNSEYELPPEFQNVTGVCDGVRFLPSGSHFDAEHPARITLSYDPDLIPAGYKPEDIYTYYRDETATWYRLQRIAVDTTTHTVISRTTHFSDFVNAVIKVPDMPESKAFVPTQMTDLPDINPLLGIPMIEVPAPNNRGTAELTYPIAIPQGRQGMQPSVDLHYSSANGNGILGVGWSLNTPAITIDTRWGVPHYDLNNETEQYLVNGAPILIRDNDGAAYALPYQENYYLPRHGGEVRFYARDTKNQDRIIRYGTNPTDYWWAVTDRNGTTTYYGRTFDPLHPSDQSIDEHSVVRTQDMNIAYWAATATVDVYGNYILYRNDMVGNMVYVQEIEYTGNVNRQISPLYHIHFGYKERDDIASNGRLGVLQTEELLLCHVLVQYQDPAYSAYNRENLAAYYMQYIDPQEITLYKSRLEEVVMLDSVHDLILDDICSLERISEGTVTRNELGQMMLKEADQNNDTLHYNEWFLALGQPYGKYSIPASTTKFAYADAPSADNLFLSPQTLSGTSNHEISSSHSTSWSIGGTATVGIGPDIVTTILSGGGNYTYSRSTGECKTMLLDLNGDALVDIVYEDSGRVYYKRQYKTGSTYAFADTVRIPGLTRLSHEVTSTHTWGLQLSLGANLSYSNPISTTYTDTYFSDVNADGLPDMIDGDCIRINQLVNGVPTFGAITGTSAQTISVHNTTCGKSIILDGEVDEHIECDLEEVFVRSYSLTDFFGPNETYDLFFKPILDTEESYPVLNDYTGAVVSTHGNGDVYGDIDHRTDTVPLIPSPRQQASAHNNTKSSNINTNDSLIYRIENNRVNVYRLQYTCSPVKVDPEIETVRVWVATKSDTITLTDSIQLMLDTTESRTRSLTADGVSYTIQHCRNVSQLDSMHLHALSYSIIKHGSLAANDYTPHSWDTAFVVQAGDVLMFRLQSGSNNRFDKTTWRHTIQCHNGAHETYDSQNDFLCTGQGYFRAIYDGSVNLTFTGRNDNTLPVTLKVEKHNSSTTLLKDTVLQPGVFNIPDIQTSVLANDQIVVRLIPTSSGEPLWSDIHLLPELNYISDFETGNSSTPTVHDTVTYYPDVQIQYSALNINTPVYKDLFGTLHKGWGMFAHQNIHDRDTIILDSLVNTQLLAAGYARQDTSSFAHNQAAMSFTSGSDAQAQLNAAFAEGHVFNPIAESNYWIPMRADSRTEQWIAYGNLGCIGQRTHSNAREIIIQQQVEDIVEYDSSLPFAQGETRKNTFVRKQSYSDQTCFSAGSIVPLNHSTSSGTYEGIVDYMDMNGDGYPDFMGKDGIQYSTPWGGIGKLKRVPNYSSFKSNNMSDGMSFAAGSSMIEKLVGNNQRDNKSNMMAPLGASVGTGSSTTYVNYIDVNADGLPDKVDALNHLVWYNLGYKFSSAHTFSGSINEGENTSVSVNLSGPLPFSLGQMSISGGIGCSNSTDETKRLFADVNGDGLPDQIRIDGTQVKVAYNKGQGTAFDTWRPLPALSCIGRTSTLNYSTDVGITGGFSFLEIVKFNIGVQSSPYGESFSTGKVMLTDVNGDGYADQIYRDNYGYIHVCYNATGKANLLTAVTNPTGHKIRLDYHLSDPSIEHRNRQWELVRIEDVDSLHPMTGARLNVMDITYDSAFYDNYEKTDYGYNHVKTFANSEKLKDEYYHNRSLLQNGELQEELLSDHDGYKYIRRYHGGRYRDISSGDTTSINGQHCDDANLTVEQEGYWTEYYERETSPQITTGYTVEYDQYHNMIRYVDMGDIAIPDDDWRQEITYLQTDNNNMISLPSTEKVYDRNDNVIRNSYVYYDYFGKPAHIHFEDPNYNVDAATHVRYDSLGNVTTIIFPEDKNGENNWSAFTYDTLAYTNVVLIDNPFNLQTRTLYDYRWGLPVQIVDPAEDTIKYIYDYKGRVEKIIAPLELKHRKDYTVRYTYNLTNHNLKTTPAYAHTHVYKDMYDSLFVQQEVSLYDKRGRMMQKKHYAEVSGNDKWVVDGAQLWDAFGRVVKQGFPFAANEQPEVYESIYSAPAIVITSYDVLDRPLLQSNADGSDKQFYYHFKNDSVHNLRLWTKTTDENGFIWSVLKSPQDRVIQQEAGDGSYAYFEYSPIGELLATTDPEGYQTTYHYDMLGRLVERKHPDAGKTTMSYDNAGNLFEKQTANLSLTNETISYIYRFSRLSEVIYPRHTENNVVYEYDDAGRIAIRHDGAGSEEFVYDRMGNVAQSTRRIIVPTETDAYVFRTQYKYDSFGRIRNIIYPDGEAVHYGYTTGGLLKTVAGRKNGQDAIYLWDRQYDEQGRKIYQLDGNGVWTQYTYDTQRQWLHQMHTELPTNDVLQNLLYTYDGVGNIISIQQTASSLPFSGMGGTYRNDYVYDPQYRLEESHGLGTFPYDLFATYSPSGKMGNKITGNPMGGTELQYGYDLQHYTHQPRTVCDPNTGNRAEFFWDVNGNLAQINDCKYEVFRWHDWDEENRLRFSLGDQEAGYYGYDANGERVYKLIGSCKRTRQNNGGMQMLAIFDDAVLYPNPYIVITSKGYTKHYYAGSERLATTIGGGGFGNMVNPIQALTSDEMHFIIDPFYAQYDYHNTDPFYHDGAVSGITINEDIVGRKEPELEYLCSPESLTQLEVVAQSEILLDVIHDNEQLVDDEKDKFFFHGDHLGSAHWITAYDGSAVQYLHYAPYGEILADQHPFGYEERFKFTGKERDSETNYDYFGARFYASLFGFWLSVDPFSDKYPNISPYAYCGWNPIKYVDPNGMDVWELDNCGFVVNKITDETQDAFRMNGKQISFEYGSVTSAYQDKYNTTFFFKNEDVAASAFKFMADNSGVEYGLVSGSQTSTIVTQHNEGSVNIKGAIASIIRNNEMIKSIIHNHPKSSGPSGFEKEHGDKQTFQKIENRLGYKIQTFIYQPHTESLWFFTPSDRGTGGLGWNFFYPNAVGTISAATPSWLFRVKNFFGLKMKL